jgi:hypothetical protein
MKQLRRYASAGAVCLGLAAVPLSIAAQKPDTKESPESLRPKLSLKAQPMIAISPARVVLTAELLGGANDYEEYYCPAVVWAWGDGTESERI